MLNVSGGVSNHPACTVNSDEVRGGPGGHGGLGTDGAHGGNGGIGGTAYGINFVNTDFISGDGVGGKGGNGVGGGNDCLGDSCLPFGAAPAYRNNAPPPPKHTHAQC